MDPAWLLIGMALGYFGMEAYRAWRDAPTKTPRLSASPHAGCHCTNCMNAGAKP